MASYHIKHHHYGFSTKVLKSGRGFIRSESIGETGTSVNYRIANHYNICFIFGKHSRTYPLSDGNLKPLPFLITILVIVISSLPAADHKNNLYLYVS